VFGKQLFGELFTQNSFLDQN